MKKWYLSKTLWANAVMFVGVVVMAVTGTDILTPEIQAGVIAGVNALLRLMTKEQITA